MYMLFHKFMLKRKGTSEIYVYIVCSWYSLFVINQSNASSKLLIGEYLK